LQKTKMMKKIFLIGLKTMNSLPFKMIIAYQ